MSTKIYGGLIATNPDVFGAAKDIRAALEPVFLNKFSQIHAEYEALPEGSNWTDLRKYFHSDEEAGEIKKSRLEYDLYDKIVRLDKSAGWTFSEADIFYQVLLIENKAGGNPLILIFGEKNQDYVDTLLRKEVAEEYGYWDNSDAPDEVSEKEWATRKKAWGALDTKAPAEVGLIVNAPSKTATTYYIMKKRYHKADKLRKKEKKIEKAQDTKNESE